MNDSTLELLPVPEASTGLCKACRADAALPNGDLCSDCQREIDEAVEDAA